MDALISMVMAKYNYWACVILMMIGLYAMIAKNNLIKKIIGMNIFQTAIILFYISIGTKREATVPILMHHHGGAGAEPIDPSAFINPLPHVLMLTAIVVAVATLGVALAVVLKIYQQYNTLELDEILDKRGETGIST